MENIFFENSEVRMLVNAIFGNVIFSASSENLKNNNLYSLNLLKDKAINNNSYPIFELDDYHKKWLLSLDRNPKTLIEWLGNNKYKLGIYHEKLWQFFLKNNGRTKLISNNLKVKDAKNDIGEFDLIYTDHSNKIFHLEIANKYYLAINSDTKYWDNWVGPNKIDTLANKMNHTLNNQINLSDTTYGQEKIKTTLIKKNKISLIDQTINKQIQINGRLFYPGSNKKINYSVPDFINSKHNLGYWLTLREWGLKNNQSDLQYKIIKKPFWLDYTFHDKDFLSGKKNPIELNYNRPEMIFYFKKKENKKGTFLFVVPNNWAE